MRYIKLSHPHTNGYIIEEICVVDEETYLSEGMWGEKSTVLDFNNLPPHPTGSSFDFYIDAAKRWRKEKLEKYIAKL